jgi:drug/metabolite transporter (DMT)-like permease
MHFALGLAAACAASFCFDAAVALQALEARAVPSHSSVRPSLLGRLLRRPRWLAATGLAALGFPFQVLALALVPVSVVQAALAMGLLLLLVLGVRMLHEHVGRREVLSTLAIVAGVTGVSIAAPEQTHSHAGAVGLALVLGPLALAAAAPVLISRSAPSLMVLGAGCAYAWTSLGGKVLADELAASAWPVAIVWLAMIGAMAVLGLLDEMAALQRRAAVAVASTVFVVQVIVPVAVAPLIAGESWAPDFGLGVLLAASLAALITGAVALMRSPAVSVLISTAAAPEGVDGDRPQAPVVDLEHQRA